MLTFLILLILFIGTYSGYKYGIITQLIKTIGYVISFIFALEYHQKLSSFLELIIPYPSPYVPETNPYHFYDKNFVFSLSQSYYYLISFFVIFMIGWFIVQIIMKTLSYALENIKVPEPINEIGGSVLGFIVNYLGLFYVLFLLSTIPVDIIQNKIADSFIADKILVSTPVITNKNYQYFIVDVHEEVERTNPLMDIEDPTKKYDAEENDTEESTEEDNE